ncbi:MAG TPA: hypothetical protein VGM69_19645 [Chloroflexota bacterium]
MRAAGWIFGVGGPSVKPLGDEETARIAERGYRDMASAGMEIDRLLPGLVIEELRQDGLNPRDVASACQRLVHEAWSQGSTTAMH